MPEAKIWKERREKLIRECNTELNAYQRQQGRIDDLKSLIEVFGQVGEAQELLDSHEGKLASLTAQIEAKSADLEKLGGEISEKHVEVRELDRALESKRATLAELGQQIGEATNVIAKAERAQRALTELQA